MDLFLKLLPLVRFPLPIPTRRINAADLLVAGGSRDLSAKLFRQLANGLSHWSLSGADWPLLRRFDSLIRSPFLWSSDSEPISANLLNNSSEDALFTRWTVGLLVLSIVDREKNGGFVERERGGVGVYILGGDLCGFWLKIGEMDRWVCGWMIFNSEMGKCSRWQE